MSVPSALRAPAPVNQGVRHFVNPQISAMSYCTYCGDSITFRYINGRCIPLHSTGSCGTFSSKTYTDFTKEHHAPESACYLTRCPICQAAVFFVRHNGGSVWLDGPLGAPWTKHGCFADSANSSQHPSQLTAFYPTVIDGREDHNDSAGVVRYARVEHESTECILETGGSGAYFLDIKNNAGYLLGQLCEINKEMNIISPSDAPELKYAITKIRKTRMSHTTFCHICKTEVSHKNIKKHLRQSHKIQ